MSCGKTHHKGCEYHERSWEKRLAKAEVERDEARAEVERLKELFGA